MFYLFKLRKMNICLNFSTVEIKIKANNRMVTESSSGEGSETRHAIDSKRGAF